ncbi:MAG TPA: DoxX family protein [Methylomirabilota bacterium]
MPIPRRDAASTEAAAQALLRAGAGVLFLQHGLQKVFGSLGGTAVPLASMLGIAGLLELVGGALLILGLWTRPVALVLAIEMLAAFVIAHLPRGGWPIQNGGELPLLYALVFLFLAARGGGPLSVDARLTRDRRVVRERL